MMPANLSGEPLPTTDNEKQMSEQEEPKANDVDEGQSASTGGLGGTSNGEYMVITKKYRNDLEKALRCAETGGAYHWPTIAEILATEIKRLRVDLQEAKDLYEANHGDAQRLLN